MVEFIICPVSNLGLTGAKMLATTGRLIGPPNRDLTGCADVSLGLSSELHALGIFQKKIGYERRILEKRKSVRYTEVVAA